MTVKWRPSCAITGSQLADEMAAARAALLRSCGPARTGRFRLLTGTATITGVAFFDVIHG